METNKRNELTMVGIFAVGFLLIYMFLGLLNDITAELSYGSFILFALLMIFLTIYLFHSSKSKDDSKFPPDRRLI